MYRVTECRVVRGRQNGKHLAILSAQLCRVKVQFDHFLTRKEIINQEQDRFKAQVYLYVPGPHTKAFYFG